MQVFEIKKIIAILVLIFCCATAQADVLTVDGVRKGDIAVMKRDGVEYAALDDILSALGLANTPATGGLVATFSGKKIEFWSGASAARVNGLVVPLRAVVMSSGGHWWGERGSSIDAIKQFLASAGRPSDVKIVAGSASAAHKESTISETVPSSPQIEIPKVELPTSAKTPSVVDITAERTSASEMAMISAIRWGEQSGALRAVIDISKQADVSVKHGKGEITVSFINAMTSAINSSSTHSGLSAAARQSSSNAVVTFKHSAKNVKGFWLAEPVRYVMDFYYEANASPSPAKVEQTIETKPSAMPSTKIETGPARPAVSPKDSSKKPIIVLDAGHGGHDPGALGNSLKEKDINLRAVRELESELKKLGFDVRMTRADDRYLKLGERTEFANKNDAAVFVSLHCNALPKGRHASGVELYLMADSTDKDALELAILENRELSGSAQSAAEINEAADKKTKLLLQILGDMQQNDKINESTNLAEEIYNKMKRAGLTVRNVRQAPFFVLRGAGMPAVLIEMGFITEKSDAKNLNSQAYRKKIVESTAAAIKEYLKNHVEGA